jgi:hypothetical protein
MGAEGFGEEGQTGPMQSRNPCQVNVVEGYKVETIYAL